MSETSSVATTSVAQLVGQLNPKQFWGVLGAVAALVAGSFSLGFYLQSSICESKLAAAEAISRQAIGEYESKLKLAALESERELDSLQRLNADLQEKANRFEALKAKEQFVSLYCRYLLAQGSDDERAKDTARRALEVFSFALFDIGNEESPYKSYVTTDGRIYVGKGSGTTDATITFAIDGTSWPIPPDFTMATLD